jgi:hypothetical protein
MENNSYEEQFNKLYPGIKICGARAIKVVDWILCAVELLTAAIAARVLLAAIGLGSGIIDIYALIISAVCLGATLYSFIKDAFFRREDKLLVRVIDKSSLQDLCSAFTIESTSQPDLFLLQSRETPYMYDLTQEEIDEWIEEWENDK